MSQKSLRSSFNPFNYLITKQMFDNAAYMYEDSSQIEGIKFLFATFVYERLYIGGGAGQASPSGKHISGIMQPAASTPPGQA